MARSEERLAQALNFLIEKYQMTAEDQTILVAVINGEDVNVASPPRKLTEAVNAYLQKKGIVPLFSQELDPIAPSTPGKRVLPDAHRISPIRITLKQLVVGAAKLQIEFVGDVTRDDIESILASLVGKQGKPMMDSTRSKKLEYISSFFRVQMAKGVCQEDPTPERPYVVYQSKALLAEEMQRTFQKIEVVSPRDVLRNQLIFVVAFSGALRVDEVSNLRKRDLIKVNGVSKLRLEVTKGSGGIRARRVGGRVQIIARWVWQLLADFAVDKHDDDYIFSTDGGKHPISDDTIRRFFNRAMDAAEIPRYVVGEGKRTLHSLRHSAAIASLEAGQNREITRQFLGHLSWSSTDRYVLARGEQMLKHVEKATRNVYGRMRPKGLWSVGPRRGEKGD